VSRIYEPPPPPVKRFEAWGHSMMGFHLGFSGDVERDGNKSALDSTLGFNLRADVPIEGYLLVGPLIQFGAWRPDVSPTPSRNYYVDFDFFLRARLPITTPSTNFQLWAGVPIGLTADILGEDVAGASSVGFGWNIGVLFGGAVHFTPKFGLFAELGWLQHKMSHAGDTGPDLDFRLAQWNFNIGFVLRN
jgi:hypothetical protein